MEYNIAKIRDKIRLFEKTGREIATFFLTPAEVQEVLPVLKGCEYTLSGGYEQAERRVIIVGNTQVEVSDFLKAIRIESFQKPLTHRSVLGSVLGLGLKREVLGDVIVKENVADIIVAQEVKEFVLNQLQKVGNEKVKVQEIPLEAILKLEEDKESQVYSVASLRADAVISAVFGIAREKAAQLFMQEKVLLNFLPCGNNSKAIKEDDLLSVRGFGRIQIEEVVRRNS